MTLLLDSVASAGSAPVHLRVLSGGWATVQVNDAEAFIEVVAGVRPGVGGLVLDGRELRGLDPAARIAAGLSTAVSRLPDLPGVSVLEAVQLGRPASARLAGLALGTSRARAASADQEAAVRALAGRMGLSRWLGREAVDLPDGIAALADVVRALAPGPRALLWRRPEWISGALADDIATVIADEQARLGAVVVEVLGPDVE